MALEIQRKLKKVLYSEYDNCNEIYECIILGGLNLDIKKIGEVLLKMENIFKEMSFDGFMDILCEYDTELKNK